SVLVPGPLWRHWLQRTNLWRRWTSPQTGDERLTKRSTLHRAYTIRQRRGLSSTFPIRSAKWPRLACPHPPPAGASSSDAVSHAPDNSLSLILRRLDEIERKLDRILEELRTPTAIGYSVRRGNLPRKD